MFVFGELVACGSQSFLREGEAVPLVSQRMMETEEQQGKYFVARPARSKDAIENEQSESVIPYVIVSRRKWRLRMERGVKNYQFVCYLVINEVIKQILVSPEFMVILQVPGSSAKSNKRGASEGTSSKKAKSKQDSEEDSYSSPSELDLEDAPEREHELEAEDHHLPKVQTREEQFVRVPSSSFPMGRPPPYVMVSPWSTTPQTSAEMQSYYAQHGLPYPLPLAPTAYVPVHLPAHQLPYSQEYSPMRQALLYTPLNQSLLRGQETPQQSSWTPTVGMLQTSSAPPRALPSFLGTHSPPVDPQHLQPPPKPKDKSQN